MMATGKRVKLPIRQASRVLRLTLGRAVRGFASVTAGQDAPRSGGFDRTSRASADPLAEDHTAPAEQNLATVAESVNLQLPRAVRRLLPELETVLTKRPRARVAVIKGTWSEALTELIRACYPKTRVFGVSTQGDWSQLHTQLAAQGPYDVIIASERGQHDPAEFYRSVLFHLRRGGSLVLAEFRAGNPSPKGLWPLISRLVVLRDARGTTAPANRDEQVLARATSRIIVGPRFLVARNATASMAKLRESEIAPVLELAGKRMGRVLNQIHAEQYQPRSVIRDHALESAVRDSPTIDVPTLSLRSYNDVVCSPGQLVAKGYLLLPETYRHHLQPRLVNRVTEEIAPRFAMTKRDLRDAEEMAGSYFHFDSEWPGHYGHVLSEQMSRLWALHDAKSQHPDLKILLGRRPGHDSALPFEKAILAAFGIGDDDITLIDRPVRVERLLAGTPMFSMPHYASPRIADVWGAVGPVVAASAGPEPTPRRFFCGRERKTRRAQNEAEIEQTFTEAGFEIVYPEHLPFATQVAMFRDAEVVAGYAGSALFTLCFCDLPKRVLMISSESYHGNNEYLIAAVLGHEFDVFWSVADDKYSSAPYRFDFEREGRHLRRVLDELD